MKKHLLAGILALGLTSPSWANTSPVYANYGTVTSPINIDATVFINGGTFDLSSSFSSGIFGQGFNYYGGQPFVTQNTVYYTNLPNSLMRSSEGFSFAFLTNGFPFPAAVFENRGQIDGYQLRVNATQLNQFGIMDAQGGGLVKIDGSNVNLTRGGVAASGFGSGLYGSANGVQQQYVGVGTNNVISGRERPLDLGLLSMPNPSSPMHQVIEPSGGFRSTNSVTVPNFQNTTVFAAYAQTNLLSPTNSIIQVIFLNTNVVDTNVMIRAGFTRYQGDEPGDAATVEWRSAAYDIVYGTLYTNYIYFFDYSATMTNLDWNTNFNGEYTSPNSYRVTQGTTPSSFSRITNNAVFTNTLISNPGYTNTVVTNVYAAYSAYFGPTASVGTGDTNLNPALFDPTNQAGRIEITASRLDLTRSRLRAGSLLSVTASNLVGTEGLLVDAPLLRMNITTTNGVLDLRTNAVPPIVKRLSGTLWAWTGVWTNSTFVTMTNGTEITTNEHIIKFHAVVIDHNFQGEQPSEIYDMVLRDTNVVLDADVLVRKSMVIDARNILVLSNLQGSAFVDMGATNFPNVQNFTNTGTITVQNTASFGNDRAKPYNSLVNQGTIAANAIAVKALSLDNNGTLNADSGIVSLVAQAAKLDGGRINAGGDVVIEAGEVKARNAAISANTIMLMVTNKLSDAGADANSSWTARAGFQLKTRPASGDLLGTTISSSAAKFVEVPHIWAATDRGVSPSGFSNNAAIGVLVLDGQQFSQFAFSGIGVSNAIYVDYLSLQNYATNYLDSLKMNTNMVLYFAAANLPAEELDGKFNGRLRWVPSYAGANSSTNYVLPSGETVPVNLSLLSSQSIDSDGDGVVNASDTNPFDGPLITSVTVTNLPPPTTLISWRAAARTAYQVEYAGNLPASNWQLLTNYFNAATNAVDATVQDQVTTTSAQRYYRVNYMPGASYQP